jgi:hypothetical protein
MARAAQHTGQTPRRPEVMAVISDMAITFLTITQAGTGDALTLAREVALLIDTVAATASTTTLAREATQVSKLVSSSLATLAQAASQQASATLSATIPARRPSTKEDIMSELTHEDEFLAHLTTAGVLAARLPAAAAGGAHGSRTTGPAPSPTGRSSWLQRATAAARA